MIVVAVLSLITVPVPPATCAHLNPKLSKEPSLFTPPYFKLAAFVFNNGEQVRVVHFQDVVNRLPFQCCLSIGHKV